jgi:DNA-binding transcriptional LysR family regulator
MVLLVPAGHALAGRDEVSWRALEQADLIAVGPQSANRRLMEQAEASIGTHLRWTHEVQRLSTAVELVAAGLGLAILPVLATRKDRHDVRVLRLGDPPVTRRLGVLRQPGHALSPAADALRRACMARLRARLAR